jgi:hypothetical protein
MSYDFAKILDEIAHRENPKFRKEVKNGKLLKWKSIQTGNLKATALDIVQLSSEFNVCSDIPMIKDKYCHRNYDLKTIQKVLKDISDHDLTIRDASRIYGISRNTLSNWRKEFSTGEIEDQITEYH